jgi:hypothetical protein
MCASSDAVFELQINQCGCCQTESKLRNGTKTRQLKVLKVFSSTQLNHNIKSSKAHLEDFTSDFFDLRTTRVGRQELRQSILGLLEPCGGDSVVLDYRAEVLDTRCDQDMFHMLMLLSSSCVFDQMTRRLRL